mgnify:CR=1 FL=1
MSRGQLPNRIRRGDVVWVEDPFDFETQQDDTTSDHPYLIISTEEHPFQGTEYLAMLVTTTDRPAAISIADSEWTYGSLSRSSHISPWTVVTLKDRDIAEYQGQVTSDVVDTAVRRLPPYIGLS